MWVLVFIYFYETEPFLIKYGQYHTMYACFEQREKLGKENSGVPGYFPIGQQAICVQTQGEQT